MRISLTKFLTLWLAVSLVLYFWLIIPKKVLAANATETFDSYADGTSLSGLTGGSGWDGSGWVQTTAGYAAETTGCQAGAACAKVAQSTDSDYYRNFSAAITKGTITYYVKGATGGDQYVHFSNDTDGAATCSAGCKIYQPYSPGTGDVQFCGTTCSSIGTLTAGSWGLITIDFNGGGAAGCTDGQAQAKLDAGSFSPCKTFVGTGSNSLAGIGLEFGGSANREHWVDEISVTDEGAAAGGVDDILYTPTWYFNEF